MLVKSIFLPERFRVPGRGASNRSVRLMLAQTRNDELRNLVEVPAGRWALC